MNPLTEQELRLALKNADVKQFTVPKGTVVTPAAMEYLKTRRIMLIEDEAPATLAARAPDTEQDGGELSGPKAPEKAPAFIGPDGGGFDRKPEDLTHLQGNRLVRKDHPVIVWRGKLDSFTACIMEAQVLGEKLAAQRFVEELQEILEFSRRLLSCEIRGAEVEEFRLLGLTADDLRARSHHPEKFFGYRHMLVSHKMGPLCIRLNTLRTVAREVELAAVAAFKDAEGRTGREDIVRALNRLSSLFYIMMYRYLPAGFTPEHAGI
ncbi:MAG: hypothetical protein LBS65_08075 [Desulfovibrio sp.]|jgi:ethanolamine utilization cobalamin adenosyltransferase|nr:hypothetical protein [Desulfovibrio sp.]